MDQQRPASHKLPAGLAGVLNSPEDHRDSAYYSGTDASSKRQFSHNLSRPLKLSRILGYAALRTGR